MRAVVLTVHDEPISCFVENNMCCFCSTMLIYVLEHVQIIYGLTFDVLLCHKKHQIILYCNVGDVSSRQKFGPHF